MVAAMIILLSFVMAVVSAEGFHGNIHNLYDTKGSAGLKTIIDDDLLEKHPTLNCHKYFQQFPSSAIRNGGGQEPRGQQSACRRKISKVKVSPRLDPYATQKHRGMPNPQGFGKPSERSRTGTNGHVHRGDNSVDEFCLANNQLRELLQQETTGENDSIFVIKDCGTVDERPIQHVHHHFHHHHITHHMFYTLIILGVALVVSLNVGSTRRGDVPYAEAEQLEELYTVPPEGVLSDNIDEPCAVPV